MGNDHARFVTGYAVSGILVVIIPLIRYGVAMANYRHSYYYAYMQQEEDRAGGDVYDMNNCKWFNPFCKSVWVNGNGEVEDRDGNYSSEVPRWFSGWSNVNNQDSAAVASSGAIKFVYSWQAIMFLALLTYGSLTLYKYRGNLAQSRVALNSLSILIFVFGNFSFLIMWLLANGSIFAAGHELEEIGGFYHQFSVMVFITNFWYLLWSLFYAIAVSRRVSSAQAESETEESDEMPYVKYSDANKPEPVGV